MLNLPDAEADFYPRPPRGGRPARERGSQKWRTISIHALREEGDSTHPASSGRAGDFYPRPPRGGRRCSKRRSGVSETFLSTPSARRATQQISDYVDWLDISIHALREEGDCADQHRFDHKGISIHALREEGDVLVLVTMSVSTEFLSTPSARRATGGLFFDRDLFQISIHALREEGDALPCTRASPRKDFYPRPPRGGRLPVQVQVQPVRQISIHALREEGDLEGPEQRHHLQNFYPRPPRGGRPFAAAATASL